MGEGPERSGDARRLLVVSGEASGDLHAGRLLAEIGRLAPGTEAFGVGGDELESAGCDLIHRIDEMQLMGFVEVIGAIPRLRRLAAKIVCECRERRPDAAILVDYPDFNLRLAGRLKRLGVPVIYYISPQVWAWRRSRVRKMRGVVDLMMVLFDFEMPIYQAENVPVEWVGHPLVDRASEWPDRAASREELGLAGDEAVLGLLPGSRPQEIKRHLGEFAGAASDVASGLGQSGRAVRVLAAEAASLPEGTIRAAQPGGDIRVVRGDAPKVMRAADLVVTASGTATLETALAGTPMVVCYRTSALSYAVARMLVSVPHIAMVNIVAGRALVPELIQGDVTRAKIAAEARRLIENPELRARQIDGLAEVREKLGPPGASARAAERVLEFLGGL